MTKRLWTTALLLAGLAGLVGLSGGLGAADKKDEAPSAPAGAGPNEAQQIAMAYDLADMGHRAKAPDLLVTAARILRRINPIDGTDQPAAEGGNDAKGEKVSLKEVADGWLAEARKMAPDDKAIAALADQAAKEDLVFPPEPGKRGTFGGPRQYFHRPGVGVALTWNLRFRGGQPASVSVQGNGRNTLTLTVRGNDGVFLTQTGPNPAANWVPAASAGYTVTVRNDGPGSAAYTLYHN
jgi:hypothetical protein